MLTYLICALVIESKKSVWVNVGPKRRKNNLTERNEIMFLPRNVVVKHAIMSTVMEQEKCYEVPNQRLWEAEETSLQTKCGSSDVDLWCRSCPLHPYLSSPSRCICKVCSHHKVPTTHAVFLCIAQICCIFVASSDRAYLVRQSNNSLWAIVLEKCFILISSLCKHQPIPNTFARQIYKETNLSSDDGNS